MSATAIKLSAQSTLDPVSRPLVLVGIALTSFSSLLLELALTRLFSVVLFYHFAFFAISVALLGLGSGGVFAHIFRERLKQCGTRKLATILCALNSLSIIVGLEVVLHTPVALQVNVQNFGRLSIIYLATAVPFFATGLLFSSLFARYKAEISLYYGADLVGGASACLAVVPLLNSLGAPNVILFASLIMAIASVIWAETKASRVLTAALAIATVFLIAGNWSGKWIDVVYAKGVLHDRKFVQFAKWNALSRVEVNTREGAPYILIDDDAATAIMSVDPASWDRDSSATPIPVFSGLPAWPDLTWKDRLMGAAASVPNVLRPNGKYAVIGPGGGVDVLRAVASGSLDVTGIEINPIIANTIMRGIYDGYSHHLYQLPQVHIYVQDGRSYVRRTKEKYDVIQMTLVDTWASTSAGAFALSENNLYTVQAFREYFDHLNDDGFLALTRWEFKNPHEALRVVSQDIEALHQIGIADPRQHFVIVADGALNVDGRPVLVLAKKSPLTATEYAAVAEHVRLHPNLVWLNPPPEYAAVQSLSPGARTFQELININNPRAFSPLYIYDVSPVTDDNPFFFFTLKTDFVIQNILRGGGAGIDWHYNLGVVLLGMLLIISAAAVLGFMFLPLLWQRSDEWKRNGIGGLLYFVALGLGYIMVEITLIQRFVLFLGHPTYALTVVVFLMLLSSGAGSLTAHHFSISTVFVTIITLIMLFVLLLPRVLSTTIGASFPVKLAVSAIVLAPLGFAMGMPFPKGLKIISENSVSRVEWAWAMNAAASVLGSVTAMLIAIHFGLVVTLLCAALAYTTAAVFSNKLYAG